MGYLDSAGLTRVWSKVKGIISDSGLWTPMIS